MKPDEIKEWLSPEQRRTYEIHSTTQHATGQATSDKLIETLESLAADRKELEKYRQGWLVKENGKLRERIEELEKWVDDLQSGMYINCVYCGHRYPPGTPSVQRGVLYEHIKICPKHPLSKATKRIRELEQEKDEYIGGMAAMNEAMEERAATIERLRGTIKQVQIHIELHPDDWPKSVHDRLAIDRKENKNVSHK